jgi:hypothetical protein
VAAARIVDEDAKGAIRVQGDQLNGCGDGRGGGYVELESSDVEVGGEVGEGGWGAGCCKDVERGQFGEGQGDCGAQGGGGAACDEDVFERPLLEV